MGIFQDKVALISGASRGVGLACARRLAAQGAKVVICARGEKRLAESTTLLLESGAQVASVTGDVAVWDDARRMVDTALEKFGRLDILVNNAGVSMRGQFADLSPEVCSRVIMTNLMGSIYLSRAAMEPLIAAKGHVVFVSSIAGLFGLPGASTYCASKKALTGLAESLRLELGPRGVHVGVVYLGFTEHDPEKRILAADGSLVPPDRPAHHTQDFAAQKILQLMERRKRQIVMTPAGTLGWLIYRLSPGIVERAVLFAQSSSLGVFQKFS